MGACALAGSPQQKSSGAAIHFVYRRRRVSHQEKVGEGLGSTAPVHC